jgi:GTP-binding protein EngB required for normal cell division/mRNA-degrading endonuclease toxin of MazEF toxin-antitoxin module
MPEIGPEAAETRSRGELNSNQQRRLYITCSYIDKLLGEIEEVLHETASPSPFARHVIDITPAQARVLEDHIRRLREQLLRTLAWQQMKPEPPVIPATRSVLTHLEFIDIAVEELKPSYMRGSGAVPTDAVDELTGVVHELRSTVQSMQRYIRQEFGTNLQSRLEELEQTGHDVGLLRELEEIVTRHGLVEFRSRIASLAHRLEDNNLEVALFGRVSCGKSSLLNALLDTSILPVGVNPITAVPTKLRYGSAIRAEITFATGRVEEVSLEEFAQLISEQGNPGNVRSVIRAMAEVPSPRLKKGILLVDTPGLGSLARRGAQETMAYLPACDLALLMIDAGVSLNEEDIGTLRLLYEGGIPSIVLLSKADLLRGGDLHRVTEYIQSQLKHELGINTQIHPVSSLPEYSPLLDQFFEQELYPRFEQARSLREASVARKIGALRDAVIAALETTLDYQKRGRDAAISLDAQEVEVRLRRINGEIGEQRSMLDQAFLELGERPELIVTEIAEMITARIAAGEKRHFTPLEISEWTHDTVQRRVDQAIARTRSSLMKAVETLTEIARAMSRSDLPSTEDAELLLREMPRFEIEVVPVKIGAARWSWLGRNAVRALVKSSLRDHVGPLLKEELHRYKRSLDLWTKQTSRKMVAFVNSFADAYRAQLNRVRGLSGGGEASPELARDLARLLRWESEKHADAR